jgi:hypothetical protein
MCHHSAPEGEAVQLAVGDWVMRSSVCLREDRKLNGAPNWGHLERHTAKKLHPKRCEQIGNDA